MPTAALIDSGALALEEAVSGKSAGPATGVTPMAPNAETYYQAVMPIARAMAERQRLEDRT